MRYDFQNKIKVVNYMIDKYIINTDEEAELVLNAIEGGAI